VQNVSEVPTPYLYRFGCTIENNQDPILDGIFHMGRGHKFRRIPVAENVKLVGMLCWNPDINQVPWITELRILKD